MTDVEFIEVTREMEKFFNSEKSELSSEQCKVWFEELKKLSVERYRQISREIYRTSKFMPKLADIITTDQNLVIKPKTDDKIYMCNKCNGTGIIIYKKIIDGQTYDFAARCNCQNGLKFSNSIPNVAH